MGQIGVIMTSVVLFIVFFNLLWLVLQGSETKSQLNQTTGLSKKTISSEEQRSTTLNPRTKPIRPFLKTNNVKHKPGKRITSDKLAGSKSRVTLMDDIDTDDAVTIRNNEVMSLNIESDGPTGIRSSSHIVPGETLWTIKPEFQNLRTAAESDSARGTANRTSVRIGDSKSTSRSQLARNPDQISRHRHKENLAPWGVWGACSVSCGTGAKERSRRCGPNCQEVESRECYLNSCHGILNGTTFSDREAGHTWNHSLANTTARTQNTFLQTDVDPCTVWSSCKDEYLQQYMSHNVELPNCPCYFPLHIHADNNVWDSNKRKFYKWIEVNETEEKLHIYKPEAFKCIRSLLFPGATTLASQVCCFDGLFGLITRGRNAGTVNLISPQISWELHYKIDILPWVICNGDWTRYNRVLSPNNVLGCPENPGEDVFWDEIEEATNY